ncbi:ribosomal protein S18-alanine N-acetyltransferase [Streptomyces pini]|nr:ribosomal protein S18-alanine N-acetyltransferase [Streptomyces pini]
MRWWDIEPVLELERELFPHDAWSPALFWSELARARGPHATRRYLVAEDGAGRVAGYGGLAAAGGTGDVQTIAAARDHWGTGLGARLLTALLTAAGDFECHEVLLEVRVDNDRARRLYERFGFETVGLRRGYYQPGNVDALVMRRPAGHAPDTGHAPHTAPGPVPDTAPDPATEHQGTTTHG